MTMSLTRPTRPSPARSIGEAPHSDLTKRLIREGLEPAKVPTLTAFIDEQSARIGTGAEAVEFALQIEDHYDLRGFLEAWQHGDLSEWPEFDARIEGCRPAGEAA